MTFDDAIVLKRSLLRWSNLSVAASCTRRLLEEREIVAMYPGSIFPIQLSPESIGEDKTGIPPYGSPCPCSIEGIDGGPCRCQSPLCRNLLCPRSMNGFCVR